MCERDAMYLLGETRSQEENASKESKETYRTHSPTFIDDRTANVYLFRPRVRHVSGISGTNMNLYSTDFVRCYVTTHDERFVVDDASFLRSLA